MATTRKFRNVASNDRVAFVIDDVLSRQPWRVRYLEVRGTAEQAGHVHWSGVRVDLRSAHQNASRCNVVRNGDGLVGRALRQRSPRRSGAPETRPSGPRAAVATSEQPDLGGVDDGL